MPGHSLSTAACPLVSVVVPLCNEQESVGALHRRLARVLEASGLSYEIILVDDGSSDDTGDRIDELAIEDDHLVAVHLSRNFGHQAAVSAGIDHARGRAVILMDGDLQDPPEAIPRLVEAWKRGAKVVVARRSKRAEGGLRGLLFPLFYAALGYLSDFPIPLNAGIFGLLDRQAVDAVNALTETNRYLPGLRAWVGFRTDVVFYERDDRAAGAPKQTFWKLLKYGLDAVFSFSYKPLRLSLVLGLATATLAMLAAVVLVVCRLLDVGLFHQPVVAGYTSIIISVLFLGGVQLVCTGILGEYVGRIYDEVKRRPLFLIERVHEAPPPP